ncbi:MAG: tetratricopeptide repeat protein [Bacteroidales bacterium]|nr:tetratricopeptide repeat protein [Bacteroidales bacterium]
MKKFLLTIAALFFGATFVFAQYDKDVFMWRGRQALSDGKYALAIENFNVLSRLDTTDYWSFFFRGIAKYNLGDLRGAQTDFDTSVRLNPVFTNGFHYRAITESRFGDYEAAFRDFDRALALRPGQTGIYFSRGVANFLARRLEDAVADFDYYIRKEPKDPAAFLNRGACHLFLADTTRALEDYNRAIRLDRLEPEGYVRRARVYASQKRYDEAVSDLDQALSLDKENTFAYFNRALIYYEQKRYNEAVTDLNTVLEHEPGNALTLYNRSLIFAQVGAFEEAIADMDRVININPGNVLAHFNRAAIFVEMGRWQDALEDYNKSIELYPDFAKAYLNRSYVENMLGRTRESKADYQTAQQKVRDYRARSGESSFADTTRRYNALLALDADFAKKDFDNELLQHRDIDIRLRPLYKFSLALEKEDRNVALSRRYENALIDRFIDGAPTPITLGNTPSSGTDNYLFTTRAEEYFVKGLQELQRKQFNSALDWFDRAVNAADGDDRDRYARYYKAFYLMNRGVLKAEMIDFIASLEGSVQTLSMDTEGSTRARVSDRVARTYDYSDAISDIKAALTILPDIPYLYFDLGNLECLSSRFVEALENYDMAIKLYPGMGDAYFNRGLVLIYLKDKEKGCIDLSRAGELGVADSYSVISKYCTEDEVN